MRNSDEMTKLFLEFAREDDRIRLVTLEGSRTNGNISRDKWQDHDISYFVTDMTSFQQNDEWLDQFGPRLMMQKPEAMELFPPELGNWFSYLILFADGNKLDLTLIPLEETEQYFADQDGLVQVLLDKDGRVDEPVVPSDRAYWVRKPTAREFDDCCNEYWFVSTYIEKGLLRDELLFAIDHLNLIARPNLLRMMSWQIGAEHGYHFSVGKNYKLIDRYLPEEDWAALLSTYRLDNSAAIQEARLMCHDLFRLYSRRVANSLGYTMPNYDEAVSKYLDQAGRIG